MFNNDTSGETHRSKTLRRLEAATLTAKVAAFALTALSLAYTVEANPVTRFLFSTVGWLVTGAITVLVITATFEAFQLLHRRGHASSALAGAATFIVVTSLDAVHNVSQITNTGVPEFAMHTTPIEGAIGTAVLASIAFYRNLIFRKVRTVLRPESARIRFKALSTHQVATVFVTVAATSAILISGVGPIAPVGNASAATIVDTQTYSPSSGQHSITHEGYWYTVDNNGYLHVFDLSTPESPTKVANVSVAPADSYIDAGGDTLAVSTWIDDTVEIVDISDPSNPTVQGSYSAGTWTAVPAVVSANYVAVAETNARVVELLDISNPSSPTVADSYSYSAANSFTADSAGFDPDSGIYYVAGDSVLSLDVDGGSISLLDSYSGGVVSDSAYDKIRVGSDGNVFIADGSTVEEHESNAGTLSLVDSYTMSIDSMDELERIDGNTLAFFGDSSNSPTVEIYNTGNKTTTDTVTSSAQYSFHAGSSEGYGYWGVQLSSGEGQLATVDLTDHYTPPSAGSIAGQVVNQNDDPVSNATVEVWAVEDSLTIPSGSSYLEEADAILKNQTDSFPEEYDRRTDLQKWREDIRFNRDSGVQVLAHRPEDWLGPRVIASDPNPFSQFRNVQRAGAGIDEPKTKLEPGEPYVLSCWDYGESSLLGEDIVDNQWDGRTRSCDITVEQISPTGETVNERTKATTEQYKTYRTSLGLVEAKRHHTAQFTLSPGVYKLTASADDIDTTWETWVVVGDEKKLIRDFNEGLRARAGQLTERAQHLQDLRNDNTFSKVTVEANTTGHFSADIPSGYSRVAVTAYKGRDGLFSGVTLENRSLTKLRDLATAETFNGTVYISQEPQITSVPDDDVEVQLNEYTNAPYTDPEDAEQRVNDQVNETVDMLLNETDDLSGITQRILNGDLNASKDELCTLYDEYYKVIRGNQYMWDLWKAQAENAGVDHNLNCAGFGEQKIRDQLRVMYNTVGNGAWEGATDDDADNAWPVNPSYPWDDPEEEWEEHVNESTGEVTDYFSGTIPWSGDLDEDTTAVFVTYANGTRTVLDEEYWSVNKRAGQPDEIVIEDFPMPSDAPMAVFDIIAAGENGGGPEGGDGSQPPSRDSWTIQNPSFQSEPPTLKSITTGTLFPAEGQQVSVKIQPTAGSTFDRVESAHVYDSSGENVSSTLDAANNTLTFTSGGPGTHVARLVIEDTDGNQFVERVPLGVADHDLPMGPVVRARSGFLGVYALAGDGAVDGDVNIDGATTTISMNLGSRSQNPSVAHVFANELEPAAQEDITVRLLDQNGQQISTYTSVNVYVDKLTDGALVRRNGDPLTDAVGKINRDGDTTAIQTYTGRDGTVDISINRDPGWIDRARYRVDSILVRFSSGGLFSFGDSGDTQQAGLAGTLSIGLGGFGGLALLALLIPAVCARNRGGER